MRRTVKLWGGLTAATETLGKFGFRCVDVGLVCSTETEAETALACNISPRCSDAVGLQCPRIESFHAECGSSITGISSTRPRGSPKGILTVVNSDLKDLRGLRWRLRLRITFSVAGGDLLMP